MSAATELAEAEAARVEAEERAELEAGARVLTNGGGQGDEPEPVEADSDELEPEPAPEREPARPAPPVEPPAGEPEPKQLRELDREQGRHEAAVLRIMGPFVEGFITCEACGGVGLTPPGPTPRPHPYFRCCETCNGFGQVLTGSLNEQYRGRDCPDCSGRGYVEAIDAAGAPLARPTGSPPGSAPPVYVPAAGETSSAAENGAEPQRFGTPAWMGDPSIGA